MITDEEFKKIKQDYNAGRIQIGVNLSAARNLLRSVGNTSSILWSSSFTIAILLSFVIGCLCIGGWGVLYGIIFSISITIYISNCSIEGNVKNILHIIAIVGLIIAFFFELRIAIMLVFLFFNLLSVYWYYEYIKKEILKKMFFRKDGFIALLEEQIIIIK